MFDNLTKFIVWTLPTNAGGALVLLSAVFLGTALPALPVHPEVHSTHMGYLVQTGYPEVVIDDIKKRALHRTKIIEGQLRGIEKMIENEDYCVDIITLSLAVQKSLGSLNKLLVENHLRTHVSEMYEAGGDQREAAVAELLRIFELSNNRG